MSPFNLSGLHVIVTYFNGKYSWIPLDFPLSYALIIVLNLHIDHVGTTIVIFPIYWGTPMTSYGNLGNFTIVSFFSLIIPKIIMILGF